jgi:hypothetical protein
LASLAATANVPDLGKVTLHVTELTTRARFVQLGIAVPFSVELTVPVSGPEPVVSLTTALKETGAPTEAGDEGESESEVVPSFTFGY